MLPGEAAVQTNESVDADRYGAGKEVEQLEISVPKKQSETEGQRQYRLDLGKRTKPSCDVYLHVQVLQI